MQTQNSPNLERYRNRGSVAFNKKKMRLFTVKTDPCFGYEGKMGQKRNEAIFKDKLSNNCINEKVSSRGLK